MGVICSVAIVLSRVGLGLGFGFSRRVGSEL